VAVEAVSTIKIVNLLPMAIHGEAACSLGMGQTSFNSLTLQLL
jgi:hypothetical protein